MKYRKSIIVDIDGTIADCDHRLHHIQGMSDKDATFKADWDAFYEDCAEDEPIEPTCELVRALIDSDWAVILVTGRSGKYRVQTEEWLHRNDIWYDLLLMRKHGDHSPDDEIKLKWLQMLHNGQITLRGVLAPWIAIEDRARVVEMWRSQGLVCLQCAKGDF